MSQWARSVYPHSFPATHHREDHGEDDEDDEDDSHGDVVDDDDGHGGQSIHTAVQHHCTITMKSTILTTQRIEQIPI